MSVNFSGLALLALLCAALHWTIARSSALKFVWSRATGRLERLLACPACSGFWLGVLLAIFGLRPISTAFPTLDVFCSGLAGLYLTPVAESVLLWGLVTSESPHE